MRRSNSQPCVIWAILFMGLAGCRSWAGTSQPASDMQADGALPSPTSTGQTNSGAGTTTSGSAATGAGAQPGSALRGATLPYWEYEAEAASTNAAVLAQSRTFGDVASEASGRSAIQLNETGHKVSFVTEHPANSIVVRYSIPDSTNGGGQSATLGLYIGGKRSDLRLTSRYAWTYGDVDAQGTGSESPQAGTAHHFFDEVHMMFAEVPEGTTVTLQRDAQDTAAFYVIDLVDFEAVPAPLAQPAGALSIVDFGATPDDNTDDSAAIARAITAAQTQNKVLYIPKGVFNLPPFNSALTATPKIVVTGNLTLQGAGMWYSVLTGFGAQFAVSGSNNIFMDFAVFGDVTYRDDTRGWQGFDGPAGTGSRMKNVWIEHETAGWWVGKGAFIGQVTQALTDGLVISDVRIRNTYADGVNFANATKNSVVEQSSFRNTGDDALATWSYSADGPVPCINNTFRFNTVQVSWRANCFALYGGTSHTVADNVCADTVAYPGILVATTFTAIAFDGATQITRNTLTRAGGPHYGQQFGALRLFADTQPVSGIAISDMKIDAPTFSGIHFGGAQQINHVTFNGVTVDASGSQGIWITSEAHGSAEATQVTITQPGGKGMQNDAPEAFVLTSGANNSGF